MLQKNFKSTIKGRFLADHLPACEKWLFENKIALKNVRKGLQDAAEVKVVKKESFIKFAD